MQTARARLEDDVHQEQRPANPPPAEFGSLRSRDEVYDDGYLRVEHDAYYVACGGRSIKLPRSEFLLFSRLARNLDRVVSAPELWRHVWGESKPLNYESLHVHIYRLRTKLAVYAIQIETMIGVGYRLLPAKHRDESDKA
jgi:two-component system, OmpR family, alkaline phosphatase synthesis response regulator PhoP